jgi:Spy/CpxP family protein refolding chaperone
MVDLPFPSLDISPLVAEYLDLTSRQISAIEHLVSQERREIEPLMIRLQSTHEKLVAAADQGRSKETNILAAIEARILTKLIIKTTRTQARLHHVLTHEQQKKLEDINRLMQP